VLRPAPSPCSVPYTIDPRRRITLNFHPDEHAALAADAARAGHASAYAYVMALVRARGAALRPVVDAHGAQRVARLKATLAAVRRELTDSDAARTADATRSEAARAADAARCHALERELAARPPKAWYEQQLAASVAQAVAKVGASPTASESPAPTPEQAARTARREARRGNE